MSTSSVKPGDVLAGKYRVERVLGAGGMGYVVAARHLQLDQLVAMKFLRKGATENQEAMTRFLREAKAVVKMRNEHIAKVFDVGTLDSGEPYIVMEYLDGSDLSALVKERHTLPASEASEYVMQACEALAEAHSLGIVHRDIKLANLFVTRGPSGGPLLKVLDFGISKTNPLGESEFDMTRTASMLGSPRFMSPEQMRDPRSVDGRSDIWSLGVVLYRLVSGHPPFEADMLGRLLTMVMHEQQAPLSASQKDLPPGFEEVVSTCLMKDPACRFGNVAELAYALVPFTSDPVRSRAAADRIAAVLGQPVHPLLTGEASFSMPMPAGSGRLSIPPAGMDGGTASPWSGTHGGARPKQNATLIWLVVAFAAMLVGTGMFVKIRYDSQTAAQQQAARAAAATTAGDAPPPVVIPMVQATAAVPPSGEPTGEPTATASVRNLPPTPPTSRSEATPRRPPAPPPPRPRVAPRSATPSNGAKVEDGIPTTRD